MEAGQSGRLQMSISALFYSWSADDATNSSLFDCSYSQSSLKSDCFTWLVAHDIKIEGTKF